MDKKPEIIRVLESKAFFPFLITELARSLGAQRSKAGKAVVFYMEHQDMLVPALRTYIECEINKTKFNKDGFTKLNMKSLHDYIFLSAVGKYLDRKLVRGNKPVAMPSGSAKYLKK